jgi:hypothetical protein
LFFCYSIFTLIILSGKICVLFFKCISFDFVGRSDVGYFYD